MWSKKFNQCISCHRNTISHKAHGLCKTCYEKSKYYIWQKTYASKNRKAINKYCRQWVKENSFSIKQSRKEWAQKNKDKIREYFRKWKSKQKRRPPICLICGENRACEWAHIIPRSKNGSNKSSNLIPLCPTHHRCFDLKILTKEESQTIIPFIKNRQ